MSKLSIAGALCAVVGVALLAGGSWAFMAGANPAFATCTLLTGLAELWVAHGVSKGQRLAWSYSLAMNGVLAVAFVFATPTLARVMDVNAWIAGNTVVVLVFAVAAAVAARHEV